MRKIMALNIVMAIIIFGGILFVALDFAFNFTGKLNAGSDNDGPMIVEANAKRELVLPLEAGEEIRKIHTAGDQMLIHVGRPDEHGRILVVSAISAKHRATINVTGPAPADTGKDTQDTAE